jgi:tetratricopeptide (TPR) repeat protein
MPAEEKKIGYYRARCLDCHEKAACTAPPAKRALENDNCITCHMHHQPGSNIAHSVVTDHRVVRDPARPPWAHSGLSPSDVPLLAFHRDQLDAKDPETARDLAIAMVQWARSVGVDTLREEASLRAKPALDRAVQRDPEDVDAWVARGYALHFLRLKEDAIKSVDAALAKAPRSEEALRALAEFADGAEQTERALKYFGRLCAEYPYASGYQYDLARQYAFRKDWPQFFQAAREALRLNPFLAEARAALAVAYTESGDRKRAAAEWRLVGVLDPQLRKALGPR